MLRRWLAALAVAALAGVVAAAGAAAQPAGEVLAFHGQCFIAAGGSQSALKQGDPVQVGDIVVVPDGARLKLRMSDGSIITAGSGTRLTIGTYSTGGGGRTVKLDLAAGLLRAVVTAFTGKSRFEVDTATSVAAVRSTDWFIAAQPGVTQVGVLSGVVSLESRSTRHAVDIPARWGARVMAGMDPVPPRVWHQSEFEAMIARTTVN